MVKFHPNRLPLDQCYHKQKYSISWGKLWSLICRKRKLLNKKQSPKDERVGDTLDSRVCLNSKCHLEFMLQGRYLFLYIWNCMGGWISAARVRYLIRKRLSTARGGRPGVREGGLVFEEYQSIWVKIIPAYELAGWHRTLARRRDSPHKAQVYVERVIECSLRFHLTTGEWQICIFRPFG